MISRRSFLGSILALGAAPAIVRADSLMRVVPVEMTVILPRNPADTVTVRKWHAYPSKADPLGQFLTPEDIVISIDEYARRYPVSDNFTGSLNGFIYLQGRLVGREPYLPHSRRTLYMEDQ